MIYRCSGGDGTLLSLTHEISRSVRNPRPSVQFLRIPLLEGSASAISLPRLDRYKPKVPVNGYWDGHGHDTLPFHGKPCSAIDNDKGGMKKECVDSKKAP
jgi:hypothetical protein